MGSFSQIYALSIYYFELCVVARTFWSWKPDLGGENMKKIRHTDKQTETVGSSGL